MLNHVIKRKYQSKIVYAMMKCKDTINDREFSADFIVFAKIMLVLYAIHLLPI